MTNAWTKGPWVIHRDFPLEVVPAGHENRASGGAVDEDYDREHYALKIADACCNKHSKFAHEIPLAEAKANARLIAAAPDMAEALEQAEACMSIVAPRSDTKEYIRILDVVRAALARASGAP